MKHETKVQLPDIGTLLLIMTAFATNGPVRGVMLTLACCCSWISVKADPTSIIYMNRTGFLFIMKRRTLAIIWSIVVLVFWIALLLPHV
jgi:hypothetical protein